MRKLLSFKLSEIRRWADSLLIVPPLLQEGLNVDEATKRSAKLIEPLRRKLAYPLFRRLLAFMLVLTAWQWALWMWGEALDGGRRKLSDAIFLKLPSILALCFAAFSLSLKSSIEQAVLYRTARQALGEVTAEEAGLPLRQDVEAKRHDWWLSFKTYAPACALALLIGLLHFGKIASMTEAINQNNIYAVKARQAAGVPLPFWALIDIRYSPLSRQKISVNWVGFPSWAHRVLDPFERQYFLPYNPRIIDSRAMTKFLLEKGFDINTRIVLNRDWTPPRIDSIAMTPLHTALTDGRVDIARLMIEHGADVHALDSIGRSPLTVAITYCPSAIEMLLASGVDINEKTRFGPSLLAAARYQWLYPARDPSLGLRTPSKYFWKRGLIRIRAIAMVATL